MENKRKHLDFLQLIITRMNVNSFLLKGWTITLAAAILVFSAQEGDGRYSFIIYAPTLAFWILDGYYLSLERQYRDLYTEIRLKSEDEIDFNLNAKKYDVGASTWLRAMCSHALIIFYGILAIIPLVMNYVMKK